MSRTRLTAAILAAILSLALSGCPTRDTGLVEETIGPVDNVLIFIRHGRNNHRSLPSDPHWNLLPFEQLRICKAMANWSETDWGEPFCGVGEGRSRPTEVDYIQPKYEKDLRAGETSTTDRFRATAIAIQAGLQPPEDASCPYPASTLSRSTIREIDLPFATSMVNVDSFIAEFINQRQTAKAAVWQAHRQEADDVYSRLIAEIDDGLRGTHRRAPDGVRRVEVLVLSRSSLLEIAERLSGNYGGLGTRDLETRTRFEAELRREYSKGDTYFYDNYWVVSRSGSNWVSYETVPISSVASEAPPRCVDFEAR